MAKKAKYFPIEEVVPEGERDDMVHAELKDAAEHFQDLVIVFPLDELHVVEGCINSTHVKVTLDCEGHVREYVYYTEA